MKVPEPRKCCFCVPMNWVVLFIGYVRLVICIIALRQATILSIDLFKHLDDSYHAVTFAKCVVSVVPLLLDFIFTFIYIIAVYRRNIKQQEVFFFYSITMSMIYLLVVILVACNMERFNILYYLVFQYTWFIELGYYECIASGAITIVLQMYMSFIVRCGVKNQRDRVRAELARQRSANSFRGLTKFNINP